MTTTFKSVTEAVSILGEARCLTLIASALRAQERSKEQGKKDRALLKYVKEHGLGGTRVNMTAEQDQD